MPGYNRAEVSAELTVVTTTEAERSPQEQVEAAKQAASDSGLAHEAGPETTVLAGGRSEVLEAMRKVIEASLDAGANEVQVKVEAQGDAASFDEGS
jgi:uncharacterized protein YqgV (UPF0045/DUF77 family)